jgi:hypothetical protein
MGAMASVAMTWTGVAFASATGGFDRLSRGCPVVVGAAALRHPSSAFERSLVL